MSRTHGVTGSVSGIGKATSSQRAPDVPGSAGLWLSRGIIVGVDGSESSVEALQCALRLGALAQTTVRAVAVWQPVPFGKWGTPVYKPAKDAAAILTTAVDRVCGDEVPEWFTALATQGAPADALIEASVNADLLIVGTRGRAKVTGMLLGSVSSACLARASCPVLVVNNGGTYTLNE